MNIKQQKQVKKISIPRIWTRKRQQIVWKSRKRIKKIDLQYKKQNKKSNNNTNTNNTSTNSIIQNLAKRRINKRTIIWIHEKVYDRKNSSKQTQKYSQNGKSTKILFNLQQSISKNHAYNRFTRKHIKSYKRHIWCNNKKVPLAHSLCRKWLWKFMQTILWCWWCNIRRIKIGFTRTKTLGYGKDCCDFHFYKK